MNNLPLTQLGESLGLSSEEALIVSTLFGKREQTVLQIARTTGINRTSVYRLITTLIQKGFLTRHPHAKTTTYSCVSHDLLAQKVADLNKKAAETAHLLEELTPTLRTLEAQRQHTMQVVHYTGQQEVRQLLWNTLHAKKIIRSFGYRSLQEAVGLPFLSKWWNETVLRGKEHRLLANPETFTLKTEVSDTSTLDFIEEKPGMYLRRTYPTQTLPITQETFIYNNVFAILQWKNNEVFGVEIYNQAVADQESKVFDFLWDRAEEYCE